MAADPREVLSDSAYTNYRNVRAVALLFVVFGSILVLAGVSFLVQGGRNQEMHPGVSLLLAGVGLCGVVGGIATRAGNKQWGLLIKVMAWLYVLGFPIGTILSLTLLSGFSQYFKSIDRLRRDEPDDDEWAEYGDDD